MKLNIFNTPDETLTALAGYFVSIAEKSIAANGRFSVALSGGSSPKKLYELLASLAYNSKVDWSRVFFFFGDERNVPKTDKDSNYLMVKTALFDPLHIAPSNIFAVATELGEVEAAKQYAVEINKFFNGHALQFDLILLGLGDNSHTASLFPHTDILHNETATVKEVYLADQQIYRISFTAPLINQALHTAYLVYGEGKAEAVHHVIEDARNIEEYPAQLIAPYDGDLQWFLDEPAASKLTRK